MSMQKVKKILVIFLVAVLLLESLPFETSAATTVTTKITLNHSVYTLKKGKKLTLKKTITASKNVSRTVYWKSSRTSVAKVNSKGVVTARKKGTATITAQIKGTKAKATCKIIVGTPVSRITMNKTTASVTLGKTMTLKATAYPKTATTRTVSWKSSNKKIATVSSKGLVTAKAIGKAVITATTKDGTGKKATCTVNVVPPKDAKVTSLKFDKDSLVVAIGNPVKNVAHVEPYYAANPKVAYRSDDPEIATVGSDGTVSGISEGITMITASAQDGSGVKKTYQVTVVRKIDTVSFGRKNVVLFTGEELRQDITILPENATYKALQYKSSNPSVASVSSDGTVAALTPGTAKITATAKDGFGATDSFTVTVKQKVTAITFYKTNLVAYVGESTVNPYTVLPSNATNKQVRLESSDPFVASVENDGTITGISTGTVTITAYALDESGVTGSYTVTVKQKATSLAFNHRSAEIYVGESILYGMTILPWTTSDKTVKYTSTNPEVASVEANGLVTALSTGVTTIIGVMQDGSGVTGSYQVTVMKKVENILFEQKSMLLYVDDQKVNPVTVLPENATDQKLTYVNSNPSVASVAADGTVTALAPGTTTITAIAQDESGVTASYTVVVKEKVRLITFAEKSLLLDVGETVTNGFTVLPANATNRYVLVKSSNENVAAVNENGLITALSPGTSTITATAQDGFGAKDICTVTVKRKVTDITFVQQNAVLYLGETMSSGATVFPENATTKSLKYTSSNGTVASVASDGTVTAVAPGTTTITASATDGFGAKASYTVTVKVKVTGITFKKATAEIVAGSTLSNTATVAPSNATNKTLTYKSSSTTVATVKSDGTVTAVAPGTATITASASDGSGIKATYKVTVISKNQSRINDMLSFASKYATNGLYNYATWTSDTSTHLCPICHSDSGIGWNCIGYVSAILYHGGKLTGITCSNSGILTNSWAAYDSLTLTKWKERNGTYWKQVAKQTTKVSASTLKAGDVVICYTDKAYKHVLMYAGDGYIYDATTTLGIKKRKYDDVKYTTMIVYRYTGD